MPAYLDDPVVRELVLCATNEGTIYQRALEISRGEALGCFDLRPGYVGALRWLDYVRSYLTIYRRTMADRSFDITSAQYLALALALQDYYADHLKEFDAAQLHALDMRLCGSAIPAGYKPGAR